MADLSVGVLIGGRGKAQHPSFSTKKYHEAHQRLLSLAAKRGISVYNAVIRSYDSKRKGFKIYYDYADPSWPKIEDGLLQPDVLWDRAFFSYVLHSKKVSIARDFRIVNDPRLTMLSSEKITPQLLFPEYTIPSYVVWRREEIATALEALSGKKLVVKPSQGSGGEGVRIMERDAVARIRKVPRHGYVIQEMVDTSGGVPGIVKGPHDLRLVFVGNIVSYAYIRMPPDGSLISNVARGGTMLDVPTDTLPKELDGVIKTVLERFSLFPYKIFTVDFLFDTDGRPYIVELNYSPGLYFQPEDFDVQARFFSDVLDHLAAAAGKA